MGTSVMINLAEKRKLNNAQERPTNGQLLLESWEELNSVYLQSLVERMPTICESF